MSSKFSSLQKVNKTEKPVNTCLFKIKKTSKVQVSLRLDQELKDFYQQKAEENNTNLNHLINELLTYCKTNSII